MTIKTLADSCFQSDCSIDSLLSKCVFEDLPPCGVLLIWHLIRQARRVEGGYRKVLRFRKRSQIRQAGNVVARSCVVASLVFSLVSLGATPTVADSVETYHRAYYECLSSVSYSWSKIEAATAQIKSDESLMTRLRAEIAKRNRQIAEHERRLEE